MKNSLLIGLVVLAIVLIVISVLSRIIPPALTGIGFIFIAILLYQKKI